MIISYLRFSINFVGGTAGAMSKITGTFGQAFASLSFDQDYRMVCNHSCNLWRVLVNWVSLNQYIL